MSNNNNNKNDLNVFNSTPIQKNINNNNNNNNNIPTGKSFNKKTFQYNTLNTSKNSENKRYSTNNNLGFSYSDPNYIKKGMANATSQSIVINPTVHPGLPNNSLSDNNILYKSNKNNNNNNLEINDLRSSFSRRSLAQSIHSYKNKINKADTLKSLTSKNSEKENINLSNNNFSNNNSLKNSINNNINISKSNNNLNNNSIDNNDIKLNFNEEQFNTINKNKFNNVIIESEEEVGENEEISLRKIKINEIDSYIKPFIDINNINIFKEKLGKFNLNSKICDIINNSPFYQFSFFFLENYNKFILTFNEIEENKLNELFKDVYKSEKYNILKTMCLNNEFNFEYLIPISEGKFFENEFEDVFKLFRNVLCNDGNGFLRTFIFAYFENLIFNKNVKKFMSLSYFLLVKIDYKFLYGNNEIDIEEMKIFLKIIYDYLKENNIELAYLSFFNAFIQNSNFEFGLIKFFKIMISNFIKTNFKFFNIENIKNLVHEKYIYKNKILDINNYLAEIIEIMDFEGDYLIFYVLPLIFDVNINFYVKNNHNNKYKKFTFYNTMSNNKNINEINLLFSFSFYKILYTNDFYKKYFNFLPFIEDFNNFENDDDNNIKIIKLKNDTKKLCENCNKIPEFYYKIHKKIEAICENCFKIQVKNSLKKRIKYFKEDQFYNQEFYCSEIPLTNATENNIYLDNKNIIIILNNKNGISEFIRNEITNEFKCCLCKNDFYNFFTNNKNNHENNNNNENKINLSEINFSTKLAITLQCGCIYCSDCVRNLILEQSKNRIILNKFEEKNDPINFVCKNCKKEKLNLNVQIKNLFNIKKLKNLVNERLLNSMKKSCCVCSKKEIEYNFNLNDKNHNLCSECKINLDKQLKFNAKRSYQTTFQCVFCDEEHIYNNLFNNNNNNFKDENIKNNKIDNNNNYDNNYKNNFNNNKDKTDNKCCMIF